MKHKLLTIPAAALVVAMSASTVAAQRRSVRLPDVRAIDGDPVVTLLPPDGIPAIDNPELVPASEARFMKKNEKVVGVVHNGIARAYSVWHLDSREIVNDVFGDDPLAVTW